MFHEAWINAATTTSERIAGLIYGIGLQGLLADGCGTFRLPNSSVPSSLLCLEVLATDPPKTIGDVRLDVALGPDSNRTEP